MVKKLLLFIPIFLLLFIPTNVFALSLDGTTLYYVDSSNQNVSSSSTTSVDWGGTTAYYVSVPMGGGSFSNIPSSYYAFFSSGQGCSNTSCILQGEFISNDTSSVFTGDTPLDNAIVQLEANGTYKNCSIVGRYKEYNRFTHLTFQCSGYNLNTGFNVSLSNMGTYSTHSTYFGVVPSNFTITSDVSTEDIVISQNNNTNQIINNQNSNTQNIINNNTQNSQNIINNQNQNTQDIIDNQNSNNQQQIESQKICKIYDKSSIYTDNKVLYNDGSENNSQVFGITNYIKISDSSKIKVVRSNTNQIASCFYNVNKSKISCVLTNQYSVGDFITIPNNSVYVRFSINKNIDAPQFEICNNGNQVLSDDLNNLNDTLNSEATPNTNEDIEDMEDMLASDTPITDLITMPLTLMHAYINGINATCSPVNLGSLYGTTLTIPCLNLEQKLGSDLWSKIDVLFSIFMCYNIGMLFITAFSGITSLRDDFDSLYVPKHADTGYQPKHGGGS